MSSDRKCLKKFLVFKKTKSEFLNFDIKKIELCGSKIEVFGSKLELFG